MKTLELGTFGAIMKFAMEIESITSEFYKSAAENITDAELKGLFEKFESRSTKRIKLLERVRRENVTEMILESITDLDSDAYILSTEISENVDNKSIVGICLEIEEKRFKFFEQSALKIGFLIEAADAFERLADENQSNMETLQNM
ncbi:MAG: hypothetical protein ACTSU3_10570 [Candidatus Thorarchaeota archaeon]